MFNLFKKKVKPMEPISRFDSGAGYRKYKNVAIDYNTPSANMWSTIVPSTISPITTTSDIHPVLTVRGDLVVNDRDVMSEIDTIKESLLIISKNVKLEEKYPELKEAYDNYIELYRGIVIADKLSKVGEE